MIKQVALTFTYIIARGANFDMSIAPIIT